MKQFYKEKKNAGFTLTELLVVAAIISLMSTLMLVNYRSGERHFALQGSAHKLAQDLRRTEELSMSLKEFQGCFDPVPAGYGIYLKNGTPNEKKRYILFADCKPGNQDYDPGSDGIVEEISLERGVEISNLSPMAPDPKFSLVIVFTPPDPTVTINPTAPSASITLSNNDQIKTISVNKSGLITIE